MKHLFLIATILLSTLLPLFGAASQEKTASPHELEINGARKIVEFYSTPTMNELDIAEKQHAFNEDPSTLIKALLTLYQSQNGDDKTLAINKLMHYASSIRYNKVSREALVQLNALGFPELAIRKVLFSDRTDKVALIKLIDRADLVAEVASEITQTTPILRPLTTAKIIWEATKDETTVTIPLAKFLNQCRLENLRESANIISRIFGRSILIRALTVAAEDTTYSYRRPLQLTQRRRHKLALERLLHMQHKFRLILWHKGKETTHP